MTQWTSEIPTEPGFYWMYGWMHGWPSPYNTRLSPKMRLVKVQQRDERPAYFTEGTFLYAADVRDRSLWTPAQLPDDPHVQLEELMGVFLNWEER